MTLKMTRKQELYLIDLGLKSLLDSVIPAPKPKSKPRKIVEKKKRGWSKKQRAKFLATMKRKFQEDTNGKEKGQEKVN